MGINHPRKMLRTVLGLFWGIGALCLTTAATVQAQTPAGSVAFETSQDSSGMDTIWSGCMLVAQGKKHPCTISGLQMPSSVSVTRVSGMVYDLKDVSAFAGVYKSVGDPLSLGKGHLTLKNENGVLMVLSAFMDMVDLQAPDSGVVIKLKK